MKRYRVITRNFKGGISIMTDWLTYNACRKFIVSRWKHWPPFAVISSIADIDKLNRKYG